MEPGLIPTRLGTFRALIAGAGLRRLVFPDQPLDAADALGLTPRLTSELDEFLAGLRRDFTIPLDLRGTPFQRRVWAAVRKVPYGATRTYREIAEQIGAGQAIRAVGAANAANPVPIVVPCHRLVGTAGDLRGYGGGPGLKARLLALERGAAGAVASERHG